MLGNVFGTLSTQLSSDASTSSVRSSYKWDFCEFIYDEAPPQKFK